MALKIKLENISRRTFDKVTGKPLEQVTQEYVCENCRHLVEPSDAFCWQCGNALEPSGLVEHYSDGEKLTDAQFKERKEKVKW